MKINIRKVKTVPIYGDLSYKWQDQSEASEQATFVNEIRTNPKYSKYALGLTHVKNEGKRTKEQIIKDKMQGLTTGFADIIIAPSFYCEIKRRDTRKAYTSQDQIDFLEHVNNFGGFGCFALGYEAALAAFDEYLKNFMVMKITKT